MLTVHHLNDSRSQRILWLLEELKLSYEVKFYQRNPKTLLAPESLLKVHPLGKSPVLTDGDITVAESGAIVTYLLDTYGEGQLRPHAGSEEYRRFIYWLHYAEGSAISPLVLNLIFTKIENSPMPFFVRPVVIGISKNVKKLFIHPQIKLHFDFIEKELSKHSWLAGKEFSAADIQMSFPIESAEGRGEFKNRPHLVEFIRKIKARPAYKRAIKRGLAK